MSYTVYYQNPQIKAWQSECVNSLEQSGQQIPQGRDLAWLPSRRVLWAGWGAVQEDR